MVLVINSHFKNRAYTSNVKSKAKKEKAFTLCSKKKIYFFKSNIQSKDLVFVFLYYFYLALPTLFFLLFSSSSLFIFLNRRKMLEALYLEQPSSNLHRTAFGDAKILLPS